MEKHLIVLLISIAAAFNCAAQNVGVGTTTPLYKFQVTNGPIALYNTNDVKAWLFDYTSGSNYFYLAENGSIRMVVANGGNVGIGTTAPAARLDVAGTANISSDLTVFGDIVVNGNKGIVRSTNGTQIKYYSQQAAFFNVGLAAFGTSAEANIAWPAGMFSSPPKVLVGDITSTGGSTGQLWRMQLVTYDVTTTGCHCVIINTWNGAVNYSVTWNIVCIGN